MKKLIKVVSVLLCLSACQGQQSQLLEATRSEGTMDAGGGGTLPAEPMSVDEVSEIVLKASKLARFYVIYQRSFNPDSLSAIGKKYYSDRRLLEKTEKFDIQILKDRACKDLSGKSVQASAMGDHTVCVSANSIAKHLIKEVAYREITALLIHEISHLIGADEADAYALQVEASRDFSNYSKKEIESVFDKTLQAHISLSTMDISDLQRLAEDQELIELSWKLYELQRHLKQSRINIMSLPYAYLDFTQQKYEDFIITKIDLATLFLDYPAEYEKCFPESKRVYVLKDIEESCHYWSKNNFLFAHAEIQKLDSAQTLSAYLREILVYIEEYKAQLKSLAIGQPMPGFSWEE